MPKETFYNLPEQKRRRVEEVMIDEFAQFGYRGARINRIVEKSGIAKGSFYQYFDGKADMLTHVTNLIGQEKMQYLTPMLQNPGGHSVFEIFRELYKEGMRFAAKNPKMIAIGNDIFSHKEEPELNRIFSNSYEQAVQFYRSLIENAQNTGEIRGGIDLDFTAHLLTSMNTASIEYWLEKNAGKDADFTQMDKRVFEVVDKLMDLVKNGIASKQEENDD